jgi:hypothetical protein
MYIAIILATGVVHAALWVGFYALRVHGISSFRDHGWFAFGGLPLAFLVAYAFAIRLGADAASRRARIRGPLAVLLCLVFQHVAVLVAFNTWGT